MKSCVGCKHLVAHGAACKGDEQLSSVEDPLTGALFGGTRDSPINYSGQARRICAKRAAVADQIEICTSQSCLLDWFRGCMTDCSTIANHPE